MSWCGCFVEPVLMTVSRHIERGCFVRREVERPRRVTKRASWDRGSSSWFVVSVAFEVHSLIPTGGRRPRRVSPRLVELCGRSCLSPVNPTQSLEPNHTHQYLYRFNIASRSSSHPSLLMLFEASQRCIFRKSAGSWNN